MTFPSVQGTPVTTAAGTITTSIGVSLPSSIAAGETLFIYCALTAAPGGDTIATPAGWVGNGPFGVNRTEYFFTRVATGAEGATVTFTKTGTAAATRWAAFRVASAGTLYISSVASGSSAAPDPPNLTIGAAADYLWFAADASGAAVNTFPTNYTTGAVTLPNSAGGIGYRQLNASSEDPGTFALSGSAVWDTLTLAFGPSVALANWNAAGAGSVSAVSASTARSALAASGVGAVAAQGIALARGAMSASGIGAAAWRGTGISFVALVAAGAGGLAFVGEPIYQTPPQRTATVPFISRSLLLKRESREQTVPTRDRSATVLPVSRLVIVPRYPRIDMPLTWSSKDPDELLDYSLNWSQALAGDTISTSDWAISGDGGLVENHATKSSSATVIWLEDGGLNQTYTVTNTIGTAGGRTFQQSVNIRILSN